MRAQEWRSNQLGQEQWEVSRKQPNQHQDREYSQRHMSQARYHPPRRLAVHRLLWFLVVRIQTCAMEEATVTHQFIEASHKGNQGWSLWYPEAQEKTVQAKPYQCKKSREMVACSGEISASERFDPYQSVLGGPMELDTQTQQQQQHAQTRRRRRTRSVDSSKQGEH